MWGWDESIMFKRNKYSIYNLIGVKFQNKIKHFKKINILLTYLQCNRNSNSQVYVAIGWFGWFVVIEFAFFSAKNKWLMLEFV